MQADAQPLQSENVPLRDRFHDLSLWKTYYRESGTFASAQHEQAYPRLALASRSSGKSSRDLASGS